MEERIFLYSCPTSYKVSLLLIYTRVSGPAGITASGAEMLSCSASGAYRPLTRSSYAFKSGRLFFIFRVIGVYGIKYRTLPIVHLENDKTHEIFRQ
jgi:hypothetical protein